MTVFYLVRHAAHEVQDAKLVGRLPGVRLGLEGVAQLQVLRAAFAEVKLDAARCGPLERARVTAEALPVPCPVEPALDEVDYGRWTGCTIAELEGDPVWIAWNERRHTARVPGGESMAEVQARVVGVIERFRTKLPEGSVALVSHGDVIRAALLHYLGLSLDLFSRIAVEPGRFAVLRVEPWGATLLGLNQAVPVLRT